jgi:hypothetical protein
MDVGQVVTTLGGNVVLLAAVGYLIRALISNSLTKEVERRCSSAGTATHGAAGRIRARLRLDREKRRGRT